MHPISSVIRAIIVAALFTGLPSEASAETDAAAPSANVVVVKSGSGTGTVTVQQGGINCGAICSNTYNIGNTISFVAAPDAGMQFTGWLKACRGKSACTLTVSSDTTVSATFAPMTEGPPKLDIDGNDSVDALTDGLLILRYLFGLDMNTVAAGAIGPNATRTPAQIMTYLTDVKPVLDIDGNGEADALTDGLLVLRYVFGLRNGSLTANALGPGSTLTGPDIEAKLKQASTLAVYVTTAGNDANAGSAAAPLLTIGAGISKATELDGATVRVAIGTYPAVGGLALAPGVFVRGGYDATTWQLAASGVTTLTGGLVSTESQFITVLAKTWPPRRCSRP